MYEIQALLMLGVSYTNDLEEVCHGLKERKKNKTKFVGVVRVDLIFVCFIAFPNRDEH